MSKLSPYVAMALLMILVAFVACRSGSVRPNPDQPEAYREKHNQPDVETIDVNWSDPVPPHDVSVTWKDDGLGSHYELYYWMDEPIGRGHQGFKQLLKGLEKLPPRSRVLIYPLWSHCSLQRGTIPICITPWDP